MGKGFSTLFSTFWLKLPNDCDSGLWSVRDCGWIYSKINDELLLLFLKAFSQVLLLLFYIAPTERNFTSKHSNLRSDKWKIFNLHSTRYRNGVHGEEDFPRECQGCHAETLINRIHVKVIKMWIKKSFACPRIWAHLNPARPKHLSFQIISKIFLIQYS